MSDRCENSRLRIMSFAEDLKQARAGRTPVLHEFLTNYSPTQARLHAFVEGDEDLVFYKIVLENYAAGKHKLYVYRCGGKARVYEIFDQNHQEIPPMSDRAIFRRQGFGRHSRPTMAD